MRVRSANVWILSSILLVAGSAGAQQADAPTVTGETGLFTLIDGWTVPDGQWSLGFYYNNWDRLVAPVPGGVAAPKSDDWDYDWNRLSASAGYGVTDRFELTIMVPYEDFSASDIRRVGYLNGQRFENDINADGLGNVRIGAKYQLFGDRETGEAVSVNLFVEAPTGEDGGVTTDDTGYGVGLNWNFSPRWLARIGYRVPGDPDGNFEVSDEIEAGVGYAAPITDRFDWISEVNATLYQSGTTDPDDAIDIATGGRLWIGDDRRWAFNFAIRTEYNQLGNTEEHCPIGGLVGLTLMPQRPPLAVPAPPPPPPPPMPSANSQTESKKLITEPPPAPPPPPPLPGVPSVPSVASTPSHASRTKRPKGSVHAGPGRPFVPSPPGRPGCGPMKSLGTVKSARPQQTATAQAPLSIVIGPSES